jgi:hypothetical protein
MVARGDDYWRRSGVLKPAKVWPGPLTAPKLDHERSEIKFPGFSPESVRRFLPRSASRVRWLLA